MKFTKWLEQRSDLIGPVYHGTSNDFTSFDYSMIGKRDAGYFGSGFYFTGSKNSAKVYVGNKGFILECYLKMKNPLEIHGGSKQATLTLREMFPKDYMYPKIVTKELIALGYDGVIVYARKSPLYEEGEIFEAVAFNKEQIVINEKEKYDSNQEMP